MKNKKQNNEDEHKAWVNQQERMFQDFKNTFEKSKKQCTSYMMVDGLGFKRALMEEVDIMKNEKVVEAERAFQEGKK